MDCSSVTALQTVLAEVEAFQQRPTVAKKKKANQNGNRDFPCKCHSARTGN